jgi:hypothetical protein
MEADGDHGRQYHDGKTSPVPCCAMLRLSAIAADLPSPAKLFRPLSRLVAMGFGPLADETPPLLSRPPIA